MSYALLRGRQWISSPEGEGPSSWPIPPVLALCDGPEAAWLAPNLETALERRQLLRDCWGWNTEVRAIR